MNAVAAFYKRQMGIANDWSYEIALKRLRVHCSDYWRGIPPTQHTSTPLPPIYSAKFCSQPGYTQFLALADEDGKIAILDTDRKVDVQTALNTHLIGHQCHDNAVCDIAWTPGEQKLVSSSSDCQSRLWDIGPTDLTLIRTFKGHSRSVKTVSYRHEDASVFATGGRDGAILVWDVRTPTHSSNDMVNRAENCIFRGHDDHDTHPGTRTATTPSSSSKRQHHHHSSSYNNGSVMPNPCKSSITGLSFQDDNTLISCGSGDGIVKIWDLRRNYSCYKKEPLPKYSLPYAGTSTFKGFTNLTVDHVDRTRLYVSCMDNTIYCYNIATYASEPIRKYRGLKNSSYYIRTCLSADGRYLLSGSTDERAYIWDVSDRTRNDTVLPIVSLEGHDVEVSCVAWGRTNDLRLVTSSDDAFLKIWRIAPSELTDAERSLYHGQAVLNEANRRANHQPGAAAQFYFNPSKSSGSSMFATPSTSGRTALKRTFAELVLEAGSQTDPGTRKRARRLFPEEDRKHPLSQLGAGDSSPIKLLKLSPLTERLDLNDVNAPLSPTTTCSNRISLTFSSPTSNLPNFVLNGEAPHLPIISPKRKLKENVDWLTKIRKQKLLFSPTLQRLSSAECGGGSSSGSLSPSSMLPSTSRGGSQPGNSSSSSSNNNRPQSPRPRLVGSPRTLSSRCTTRSNSTDCNALTRTPSSSRRNSTTTPTSIRRFLNTPPPATVATPKSSTVPGVPTIQED